jgi:tetratricopeptide (TPR) repeat protein
LIFYSYKTISRNKDWKSDLTLYSADVKKSPNSTHMRYHYGLVVMKELAMKSENENDRIKYLKEAVNEFETAIKIYPSFADPHEQLGLAYFRLNDYDKSLKYYLKSLEYNPYKPVTYSNMGMIFFSNQQYEKALEVYKKAVELNPKYIDALYNLASTYGTIGQFEKAIETFNKVIELNPNHSQAYYFMAITYKSMGQNEQADYYFNIAYKLNPSLKPK